MEKLSRRAFLRGMAAAGGLACLPGCGGQGMHSLPAASASPAESAGAPSPCTLSWYVNYSWFTTPWGGNHVSDAVTAATGDTVSFVTPSGSETEKLAALMTADNLPDLITLGWWESQLYELITGGYVYALDELAETSCPAFTAAADPDRLRWYTRADGRCYCYPNSSYTPKNFSDGSVVSNQAFLVRADLYEALGRPDMTTPEGFAGAIRAAAAQFPLVDGQPLIPFGAQEFNEGGNDSLDKMLMNFLAVPFEKDGESYDRYTDPEYLRWLRMFRALCAEGYLTSDLFLDKRSQMEEKLLAGRYFCMLYQYTDMQAQQKARYAADPASAYLAVDGPKNSAGAPHTLPCAGIDGWTVTLISKKCARPDRAIALMAYLMSETGQKLTSAGIEGRDYTLQDGKAVFTGEAARLYREDYAAYTAQIGADNTYWMLQDNYMQSKWLLKDDPAAAQMAQWARPYTVYASQYDYVYEPGSELAVAADHIRAAWGEVLPQLLLAESDEAFDAMLADFVRQREDLGFAALAQENTRQMHARKQKLGLE